MESTKVLCKPKKIRSKLQKMHSAQGHMSDVIFQWEFIVMKISHCVNSQANQ